MNIALLFLLAITGPTAFDAQIAGYRNLVARAAQATESTSQSKEIKALVLDFEEGLRLLTDPVFMDTFFIRAFHGRDGIWHRFTGNSEELDSASRNGGPFTFNVPVEKVSSTRYKIPDITIESQKSYFLSNKERVLILNKWIFSETAAATIFPQKPKYFRGDSCWIGPGYYKTIQNFGDLWLVEYEPWKSIEGGCPKGSLFQMNASSILEKINETRKDGCKCQSNNLSIFTTLHWEEQDLENALAAYGNEVQQARRSRIAKEQHVIDEKLMYQFLDNSRY